MSGPKKLANGKWFISAGRFSVHGNSKTEVVEAALKELEDRASHEDRGYIVCKNGTMLALYWEYGSFGYDIIHPGERVPEDSVIKRVSRNIGEKTFDEVVQRAKAHAEQCYGGIA
jgi:hypothetical protein